MVQSLSEQVKSASDACCASCTFAKWAERLTGQFANKQSRGQPSRRLVNS